MDHYTINFKLEIVKELLADVTAAYWYYMQKQPKLPCELSDAKSRYNQLLEINDRLLLDYNTIEAIDQLEQELLEAKNFIQSREDHNCVLV